MWACLSRKGWLIIAETTSWEHNSYYWEWQELEDNSYSYELEDATSWGHVWRPWPRGARWAFSQKMSPTKVIFSTKVVYFVDLDLALLNLISTYDIVKQMTTQEKQKN